MLKSLPLALLSFTLITSTGSQAAEGMWTLDQLPVSRMNAEYGFTPTKPFIDRIMRASVRFAGGCSASFISPQGLVMTNHHCASDCIEQLSTEKKNYISDGFLAATREQEVQCPEIELNRLELITDVTSQVKAATAGLEGDAFKQAQNAVVAKLTAACVGGARQKIRCDVVDLYRGGRYDLYQYHRFQDVRLVFAPEKTIAYFGGDSDNFNFPRYNMDVSILRAYEDGQPAMVQDFFPFSKAGVEAGEMVFTLGHPGSTQRQLTMAQLANVRDVQLIDELIRLSELRGVLEQYSKVSPEAARTAEGNLFGIENKFKSQRGRLKTILDPEVLRQKQAEEDALRKFVAAEPSLRKKVGGAWDAIEKAQTVSQNINNEFQLLSQSRGFAGHYFSYARTLVRGAAERTLSNSQRLPEFNESRLQSVEQKLLSTAPVYPELEKIEFGFGLTKLRELLGTDHPLVRQVLGKQSPDQLAASMVGRTKLGDPAVRKALWQGGMDAVMKSDDPFIKLAIAIDPAARAIRKRYETEVESVTQRNAELLAQARFLQKGTSVYPDATLTLRLSYGEVAGWSEDGKPVAPFTQVAGAFERETGVDPFALPASWHTAKSRLNPAQRFNFVTTNDIIGGNSGSPIINRKGEIVGLVFDGNIHSLGGSFIYDKSNNRTIGVHSSLLLEAMDKVYHATDLLKEINAVQVP